MEFFIRTVVISEALVGVNHVIRDLSISLNNFIKDKDYGDGVLIFSIGFTLFISTPGYEHWYKEKKPKFIESKIIKLITNEREEIFKLFSYEIKLNNEKLQTLRNSSKILQKKMIAKEVIDSFERLEKWKNKINDFDLDKCLADVVDYLTRNVLIVSSDS